MIQLIVGPKGTGKTKRILDMVNAEVAEAKGNVIFIDDDKRYMYDISHQARFVNVKDYAIDTEEKLYGFFCGMLAQNFDISAIYVDAFLHILHKKVSEIEWLFQELLQFIKEHDIKMVFNVSAALEDVPEYMKPYII